MRDGCRNCEYVKCRTDSEPCVSCLHAYVSMFQPKPKNSETRWKRINDMLECLSAVGIAVDLQKLKNLLIELRDEEENV